MLSIGLDVHSKYTTMCVLDANGKIVKEREIHGDLGEVVGTVRRVGQPFAICYEASCGYGWLHDQLSSVAAKVLVAHPGRTRLIFQSKRKNDRIDARKLAKLLYLDEVPQAYVPPAAWRAWREMVEYRTRLVNRRTAIKNEIRALLRSRAITAPKGLFARSGQAWLKGLELDEFAAVRRDLFMDDLSQVSEKIKRVEKTLATRAAAEPAVALLRSIPGVGIRTAEAFVAYVCDPRRFRKNKSVGCYFGLVPCEDTSVKARFGHITKDGPATVRRLVTEAAWQAIRRDKAMKAYFERIVKDDPNRRKIALIATAHHLVRVMHSMWVNGTTYQSAA